MIVLTICFPSAIVYIQDGKNNTSLALTGIFQENCILLLMPNPGHLVGYCCVVFLASCANLMYEKQIIQCISHSDQYCILQS